MHLPASALSSDNDPIIRVKALIADFDSLYRIEPSRAKGLILQALSTSLQHGFQQEYADSQYRLGKLMFTIGRYDSALQCFDSALAIYRDVDDPKGIASCYKDIGSAKLETGKHEESLEWYSRGLQIARQRKLRELEALFINNIGLVYLQQQHYEKALEHFTESAQMIRKGYDYAVAINNMGVVKQRQQEYQASLELYSQSLKACQELKDEYCSLTPLNSMASVYLEQEEFEKAREVNKALIAAQEKLGLEKALMASYNRMGLIFNQLYQYDDAIQYFQLSLEIAENLRSGSVPYIHSNLADAYANKGQFKEALAHTTHYYEMKDSIYSLEYKVRTEELLARYETQRKEQEIALLRKDRRLREIEIENKESQYTREMLKKTLEEQENKYKLLQRNREIGLLKKDSELQKANLQYQQEQLERQTMIRNLVIGGAILILIPTFVLLVVYRQKVKSSELLAAKTDEINRQKTLELLRMHELKAIRAHIEGQEKEKNRIAKELHDGVAGTLAGIKMRIQALGNQGNAATESIQLIGLLESVDNVYREVRHISHHLTPPGMERYSFVEFVKKYLDEIAETATVELECIFHNETELNRLADEMKVEIYRILQELTTNVVKHSRADFAEIQLMLNEGILTLIVDDRGIGFDTQGRHGGLGLNNIRSRVKALGGQVNIDSLRGRGAIVSVEIDCRKNNGMLERSKQASN